MLKFSLCCQARGAERGFDPINHHTDVQTSVHLSPESSACHFLGSGSVDVAMNLLSFEPRYIDVGRPDKKQGQLSDLYGALNIGQSIIFVNSRQAKENRET